MDAQTAARADAFTVDLPAFSGPFRLLADLILAQRIDVCDVEVAAVTARYLESARSAQEWTLEEATWFLAVVAALLELKVGRLLPRPRGAEDDDDLMANASPDLAYARSLELAAFRRAATQLSLRFEDGSRYFARDAAPPQEFAALYPDVMDRVTPQTLAVAAATALRPPPLLDLTHVAPIRVTVAEALRYVESRLRENGTAAFRELAAGCPERIHVVMRFLALLELYREGKVDLSQARTFGDIEVRWRTGEAA